MSTFFSMFLERKEELLNLFIEHLDMTTMAVFISLVIGIPLALLITKNKPLAVIVIGIANLLQSIPSIALLAFMVPFVGIGQKPAIIMVVLYSLLPIIKNTYTGITSIDPGKIEVADGIGLSPMQRLFQIQLPMAAPFIMAGIRISAVTAVGTVTIAAFAGAGGLGWFINLGLNANDPNLVLLGAIPASLLALLVDYILAKLEEVVTPEGLKPPAQIIQQTPKKILTKRLVAFGLCALMLAIPVSSAISAVVQREERTIVVGSENFTEPIILGYMYKDLIESNTDIQVEERFNLNGTPLAFAALKRGDIDMFTDYTGVVSAVLLKLPLETDTEKVYQDVKTIMDTKQSVLVSEPLGFSNEYVISASPKAAETQLRFGCTTAFSQREDCLPKMKSQFGIHFKSVLGLEGNIRYQAIDSDKVDVTDAYSTDAMTVKVKLVPLEDDLSFFPPYEAINLLRKDLFSKYPEIKPILEKLDHAITTEEMAKMNYAVDVDGKKASVVAHDFLVSKGLVD